MVRARQGLIEGEVLLDHRRVQCDRRQGDIDPGRVVGEAGRPAELSAHGGHGAQVGVGRVGRVVGDAVEDGERPATLAFERGDRAPNLVQARHAGGQNDRFGAAGDVAQQRQVGDLPGRHLEGGHAQIVQKVDAWMIEGRGKEDDALGVAVLFQLVDI